MECIVHHRKPRTGSWRNNECTEKPVSPYKIRCSWIFSARPAGWPVSPASLRRRKFLWKFRVRHEFRRNPPPPTFERHSSQDIEHLARSICVRNIIDGVGLASFESTIFLWRSWLFFGCRLPSWLGLVYFHFCRSSVLGKFLVNVRNNVFCGLIWFWYWKCIT